MSDEVRLPDRLFRVTYDAAVGFPVPDDRRRQRRTFDNAIGAAKQVQALTELPKHLSLVAVHVGTVTWQEISVDQLPEVTAA